MTFLSFVAQLAPLFNGTITALAAVAVLIFMLGMMRYLFNVTGDTKRAKEGRQLILWGIIALFVIFCVGGILNFFAKDFFGTTVSSGGSSPTGSPDAGFKFSGNTFNNFNPQSQ